LLLLYLVFVFVPYRLSLNTWLFFECWKYVFLVAHNQWILVKTIKDFCMFSFKDFCGKSPVCVPRQCNSFSLSSKVSVPHFIKVTADFTDDKFLLIKQMKRTLKEIKYHKNPSKWFVPPAIKGPFVYFYL
jgi:hypothetical protein